MVPLVVPLVVPLSAAAWEEHSEPPAAAFEVLQVPARTDKKLKPRDLQ